MAHSPASPQPPEPQVEPLGQAPVEINGITEQHFRQWARSPATAAFRQYLQDYSDALRRDHLARWEAGGADQALEDEARGRINTLAELGGLEFEHMAAFYESPQSSTEGQEAIEELPE